MAETKAKAAKEATTEETFDFYAPISRENQKDIFASVNGRTIQIKRGEHVQVPIIFKGVLENQQRMDALAYQRAMDLSE